MGENWQLQDFPPPRQKALIDGVDQGFAARMGGGGGNADLPQNSLKAHAPRNYLIINAEIISHNHFPPTRPEKRFSPLISRHRTRVTGLQ
ncbi:MAG: hypothetical protein KUA35_07625 [Pseudodesulfovibrio sp.]|uniref:Uncharacterized protein n=1 Tax=Pseudodesulfovibrio aespoeensis (strain ATCC 700646 / DSM 10631 / Aspo-2) TaxID=643562 RepID=E6VXX2_PSEA9|nr:MULTISPECIES: hypothetical protein [Pseudodesulfovibrio]ADU62679.1 hypothetical protein Daes_1666 [Pseudodesulfovibrio aespoeensis Aspo-2]MBV1763434.1 hypothetical protein [Pseudodesulfovibrio sp.]MBV1772279.1 hypothetical protein [Pseudodesulfovibrio sp.]MCG2731651.1 hypothetical protein [Pseudodesulfovibrio aespoeensis]